MDKILFKKDYSNTDITESDVTDLSDLLSTLNQGKADEYKTAFNRHAVSALLLAQDQKGLFSIAEEEEQLSLTLTL
jgi:hypothetical protein